MKRKLDIDSAYRKIRMNEIMRIAKMFKSVGAPFAYWDGIIYDAENVFWFDLNSD